MLETLNPRRGRYRWSSEARGFRRPFGSMMGHDRRVHRAEAAVQCRSLVAVGDRAGWILFARIQMDNGIAVILLGLFIQLVVGNEIVMDFTRIVPGCAIRPTREP